MVMEAEEAADAIAEYGLIDEEKVEEIRAAGERQESAEEAAAQRAEEIKPQAPSSQSKEDEPVRRFILCPKCGERIWL